MRIGIDIGTSVTKGVLFDSDATAHAGHESPTRLRQPMPGRFEYDVAQVVESVLTLLASLGGEGVDLIAVTGQGDGLWLLDDRGEAVRPAISWLDDRGTSSCREWNDSGALRAMFGRTANAPFPGAGAAVLAALDRTEPESLDAACTATQCQHVVFQALTGVRTATRTCAMLPVFNPSTGDYDAASLRLAGIDHRRHLLPDVASGQAFLAPLLDAVADRLGFARGTMVATGPYDLPAAALGVGPSAVGDGLLILGTTLACQVRTGAVDSSGDPVGLTLCGADGDGWLRAMPAMVGTAGLDWVLRLVSATHSDLGRLLSDSPAGARGVAALPYLSPSGERAPFADPRARGEFTGLSIQHTAADVVRGLCESLAYAARHCFEAAGLIGEVMVCGGGSASEALTAIFADVLDRPLVIVDGSDATARGAVIAAAGAFGDPGPGASTTVPRRTVIEPRPANRAAYDDGFADYLDRLGSARRHGWRRARIATPLSGIGAEHG